MIVECGICGNAMEVGDDIADGQCVVCPHCGETSEFRRPSRVELPTDLSRKTDSLEEPSSAVPSDVTPRKTKLSLRPPQHTQQTSSGARRSNDYVRQVEARAIAEERKKRAARIKARLSNLIALLILAGLGYGGYVLWRTWQGGAKIELPHLGESRVEEPSTSGEALRESERQRELERERQREAKEAEEAKRRDDEQRRKEAYLSIVNGFAGAKLAYWGELPKNGRPGASEGTFGLAVPKGYDRCEYFRVDSQVGRLKVRLISEKSEPQEVAKSEYEKMMVEHGGFFLKDGRAYFVTVSKNKKVYRAPTGSNESFSPAKAIFGVAYPIVAERQIDTKERGFEVLFAADDKAEPVKVGDVPFDGEVGYAAFAEVARKIIADRRRNAIQPDFKAKKLKRTVVFYDGVYVAKGVNGETKVPRKWRSNVHNNTVEYHRYLGLCNEARRQEREQREAVEEAKKARREWNAKMNAQSTEYEIGQMLRTGVVTVKMK
ncbi:MAG: hypothetical protein PUJ80_05150 [Verrucomicrobiota bacterium]|nr:hypothetical protein [Verrucomicrobiota bacterium]